MSAAGAAAVAGRCSERRMTDLIVAGVVWTVTVTALLSFAYPIGVCTDRMDGPVRFWTYGTLRVLLIVLAGGIFGYVTAWTFTP